MWYKALLRNLIKTEDSKILFARPRNLGYKDMYPNFNSIKKEFVQSVTFEEMNVNNTLDVIKYEESLDSIVFIMTEQEAEYIVQSRIDNKETNKRNRIEVIIDLIHSLGLFLTVDKFLIFMDADNYKKIDIPYKWIRSLNVRFADSITDIYEILGQKSNIVNKYAKIASKSYVENVYPPFFDSLILAGLYDNINSSNANTTRIISAFDYITFVTKLIEYYYCEKKNIVFDSDRLSNNFYKSFEHLINIIDKNDYIYNSVLESRFQISKELRLRINELSKWLPITIEDDYFSIKGLLYYIKELRNMIAAHGFISDEISTPMLFIILNCTLLVAKALKLNDFHLDMENNQIIMNYPADKQIVINNNSQYFVRKNSCICLFWEKKGKKNIYIDFFDGEHFTPSYEEI